MLIFSELPEDMQVLLLSFAEDRGYDFDADELCDCEVPVMSAAIDTFVAQILASQSKAIKEGRDWWDYRGSDHVSAFKDGYIAGDTVPPIVVENGQWIDGRHRILGAHAAGKNKLPAIDLIAWIQCAETHSQKMRM